jgi:hypothetical protein
MVFIFRKSSYLLLFLLSVGFAKAQHKFSLKGKFIEYGFITGFGHGTSTLSIPEGVYRPVFLMGHFGMDLSKRLKDNDYKKGVFTLYSEPQFNLVYITNGNDISKREYEFGLNSGLKYMYPIVNNVYIFISGGTGLHAFSTETRRQHTGFIFSNNFGTGFYIFPYKNWAFSVMYRLRHMSNLNIMKPNEGINTHNFHFGISFFIR